MCKKLMSITISYRDLDDLIRQINNLKNNTLIGKHTKIYLESDSYYG